MADYAAKSEILKANFLENMRSFAIMFILSNKRNWYLCTRRERFLKLQFVAKHHKMNRGLFRLVRFGYARKSFWLKQGFETGTAGFHVNRLKTVLKMIHTG